MPTTFQNQTAESKKPDPTPEDVEELLLICRYGELDELQQFIKAFGQEPLEKARDEGGNGILHMVCGNGHIDLLNHLLPILSHAAATLQNASAKSTPLHWATVNKHLDVIKKVVEASGPGVLDIKNSNGRSVITEAEMIGWEEGVSWMMTVMSVDTKEQEGDEVLEEGSTDVEVEIQDAEGRIAKMNLGAAGAGEISQVKGPDVP